MRSVYLEYARAIVRYLALLSVRSGLLYSVLLHVLVLVLAFSDIPFLRPQTPAVSEPIAIELVTIADRTNLPKPSAKPKVKPKVKPRRETAIKTPEPKPRALKTAKAAVSLPAPPKPKPAKIKKPAKKIEIVKVKPRSKPKPKPKPKVEKQKSQFDLGRIAALINKEKVKRTEDKLEDPKIENAATSRNDRFHDQPLTISEKDAIKLQIQRCWSLPAGAAGAEDLVVKVRLFLRPDGSLSRRPEIVDAERMNRPGGEFFRTAAESAVRAVLKCEPLRMPPKKYERWREMVLTFDPSEMLGG